MRFDRAANGELQVLCDTSHSGQRLLLPKFVADHFRTEHLPAVRSELRTVDRDYIVGKWTIDLRGPSATFLLAGAPGLFHRAGPGPRQDRPSHGRVSSGFRRR